MLHEQAASLVANRYYRNVATFKGGLPAWERAGYPLNKSHALPKYKVPKINGDKFKKLVGTACILDIRTPKLYGKLKLKRRFGPNAENLTLDYKKKYFVKIPLSKLSQEYKRIPRDRKIVVMDHRGKQSNIAARFLLSKGFKDVFVIKGGIAAVPE